MPIEFLLGRITEKYWGGQQWLILSLDHGSKGCSLQNLFCGAWIIPPDWADADLQIVQSVSGNLFFLPKSF